MRIPLVIVPVALLLSSLVAQGATPGPCGLLTKAEVEEALGGPVSDGVINAHNKAVCDFKSAAGVVNVSLVPKRAAENAQVMVSEMKKRNIQAQVVPGIGDSAYSTTPGMGMQQYGAFKGSSHVIVTAMLFGRLDTASKTLCQTLLRKALTRVE